MEQGTAFVAELHTLQLREPFRIAHGASTERNVLRVSKDGAIGEAPFVPYYHDSPDATLEALAGVQRGEDVLPADAPRVAQVAHGMLMLDLQAREAGLPLWKYLKLPDPNGREACRSLGIPTQLDDFREKVCDFSRQFRVLKLKLGSGDLEHDAAIVSIAREAAPHATLIADVNGGWSPMEAAVMITRLVPHGLALLEQPVTHKFGLEPWQELRALLPMSPVPLFADESVQTDEDMPLLVPFVDGVSVKLLKCGGIAKAIMMIEAARVHGKQVLLSCMIESSIGITAAAHLAGLVDYIDLDGHLFLANDDYTGVIFDADGLLHLPEVSGLGVRPRTP